MVQLGIRFEMFWIPSFRPIHFDPSRPPALDLDQHREDGDVRQHHLLPGRGVRFTQGMDGNGATGGMGLLFIVIICYYGSFPHSLLCTSKSVCQKNLLQQADELLRFMADVSFNAVLNQQT